MKKIISLPIILFLAFIAGNASALFNDCCEEGPLEPCHWFVKPKIGVAPSIFASHRAHQLFVVPWAGVDTSLCETSPICNVGNFANVLQEGPCIPKFSDIFHQGVLHVGVEVGYNVCDRSSCFLEFIYNHASGDCVCCEPFITNKANIGCTEDCDKKDCSAKCKTDCCPTGDTLSAFASVKDDYDNYQAYGAYIGGRHFTNRFWCDSTAFWYGYKVGILHRKRVDACTNIIYNISEDCDCSEDTTVEQSFNRAVFCKSNSVSGGVQAGFDYCYSDCLSFQFGFEVVASCGLRGNKNHPIDINTITCDDSQSLTNCLALPSNIVVCNTGTVLNFPIWFGLRWEFGCCDPCADRCN